MQNTPGRVLVAASQPEAVVIADELRAVDYEVIVATSALDAVHFAKTWAPDVIVCDSPIKGMIGHELSAKTRELGMAGAVPILFLRGFNNFAELAQTVGELVRSGRIED